MESGVPFHVQAARAAFATKLEQVVENLGAEVVADKLTCDYLSRIDTILDNKPEPDYDFRS